jgi:ATP-dependent exoDNAse (exonuclease V) alpha subunit
LGNQTGTQFQEKSLPLHQANTFSVYRMEQMPLADRDTVMVTKKLYLNGHKFRNNKLMTAKVIDVDHIAFADGPSLPTNSGKLNHLDQGIAVTSHASQGKTIDQVIVSAPVALFSKVNQARLYVSMFRARQAMHLLTYSIAALREAVVDRANESQHWN